MIINNKNNLDSTIKTMIINNKNNLDSTIKTIMVPIKKMQTVFSHLQGGNEVVTGVVMRW